MEIRSVIERRILLNYQLDRALARDLLPAPLRPQIVQGNAVAGTCFIRLAQARPAGIPASLGWRMENAADRIAVEWDGPDGVQRGVFLPQQFSGSRFAAASGRWLPGPGERGTFRVQETDREFRLEMHAREQFTRVHAKRAENWHSDLFPSHRAASEFVAASPVAWSAAARTGVLTGVRLRTGHWATSPLEVRELESSFFNALPADSARFDHALLMQAIPARWSRAAGP